MLLGIKLDNKAEKMNYKPNSDVSIEQKTDSVNRGTIVELTTYTLRCAILITLLYFLVELFYFNCKLKNAIINLGTLEPLFILLSYFIIEFGSWLIRKLNKLILIIITKVWTILLYSSSLVTRRAFLLLKSVPNILRV